MTNMFEAAVAAVLALLRQGHAIIMTASGGKDSTTTTLIALEALRRAQQEGVLMPTHYVTSADTLIENPSMANHLALILGEIETWCAQQALSVAVRIATPSLASQFVVSTIGRGTLVRTPENGVKDGQRKRPCSDDWKVQPQERLAKELREQVLSQGFREPVTILGTRRAESSSRSAAMLDRGEQSDKPVRNVGGFLTLSPIADWSTDQVWEFLGMFNSGSAPWPSFTDGRSITRMLDLYREGNEGTCGVVLGEGGNKSACGSRFGCALCCVTGERDKSMEAMIQEPKHAHLKGLNDFRNFLVRTQWDMTRRELVGRTLSDVGYLQVRPDVYSMKHRLDMLRMVLTLDALELERAEQHEADLLSGRIADTPDNRELADIQFQLITPQQLVAIDFQLSLHHYAPHAFPALHEWHQVHALGRRYPVPAVPSLKKVDTKVIGWFPVGQFDKEVPTDGLRSYDAELWNPYRHPERPFKNRQIDGDKVVWFDEAPSFTVDAVEACAYVTCTYDTQLMLQTQLMPGIESARFWLNQEIVKLAAGTSGKYQYMAKRGQYFAHLAETRNLTPSEMDEHLVRNAISDAAHDALLAAHSEALALRPAPQPDLFGDAEEGPLQLMAA
ncbi:MAG: phosphoadenosine phosphosulfate reductase family protein [Sulfuritalea sp.]|nr:phosphoadenosine phosphosulfate reductase family protein [Sulfuritalea sp.]